MVTIWYLIAVVIVIIITLAFYIVMIYLYGTPAMIYTIITLPILVVVWGASGIATLLWDYGGYSYALNTGATVASILSPI